MPLSGCSQCAGTSRPALVRARCTPRAHRAVPHGSQRYSLPGRPRERRRRLPSQLLVWEELADGCGDLVCVGFECEVACVEELDVGARDVTFEGLGSGGQEERVVAAPD